MLMLRLIWFCLEIVAADIIARYHRELLHHQVIFNTGTDEHGQKLLIRLKQKVLVLKINCDQWPLNLKN